MFLFGFLLVSIAIAAGFYLLLRHFIVRKKIYLPKWGQNLLGLTFIVFLALYVASVLMAKHSLHFRGYSSSSIIFIGTGFSGMLYFLFAKENIKESFLFMFIRLVALFFFVFSCQLLVFLMIVNKENFLYADSKFRLEYPKTIISRCGLPQIFKKRGVFEKELHYVAGQTCVNRKDIDSIRISETSTDTVKVTFYHHSSWNDMPNPVIATAINE